MTKADRIRSLLAQGKSLTEIAETVGCLRAYVRVIRNGRAKYDRKYSVKPAVREKRNATMRIRNAWRYHNDPTYQGGKLWRLAQRAQA